jgi:hypothetical protein
METMYSYLNLPGNQLRAELKSLTGRRGLGVCGLLFRLELLEQSPGAPPFVGALLLLQGELFISFETEGMHYVGRIQPSSPAIGASPVTDVQLSTDLSSQQVRDVEEKWKQRPLNLYLNLHGTVIRSDGSAQPIHSQQLQFSVEAGQWGKVLEQCGHGQQVIAHLPSEGPSA